MVINSEACVWLSWKRKKPLEHTTNRPRHLCETFSWEVSPDCVGITSLTHVTRQQRDFSLNLIRETSRILAKMYVDVRKDKYVKTARAVPWGRRKLHLRKWRCICVEREQDSRVSGVFPIIHNPSLSAGGARGHNICLHLPGRRGICLGPRKSHELME